MKRTPSSRSTSAINVRIDDSQEIRSSAHGRRHVRARDVGDWQS
jgi:hypothetical protein